MAQDFSKRINKQSEQLNAGETCEAAVVTKANVGVGAAFGAVGVLAQAANQKRKANKAGKNAADSLAAQVPAQQMIVGVTNERLVFFTVTSVAAKAKELAAAFPFNDVAGIEGDKSMTKWGWTVSFADGSACTFETQKNQNNQGFHDMLASRAAG